MPKLCNKHPRPGYTPATMWRILVAIITGLSDKKLSLNSVKMTQKSCFLMVAEPGFDPGPVR